MIFAYDKNEVVESLQSARNINAAIKSFLKHEVQKGDPVVKFVKALKVNMQSKAPNALTGFLEKHLDKYEEHIFLISRYAHTEAIEPLLNQIITEYAEPFNESYTTNEGTSFSYRDQARFKDIAEKVSHLTEEKLKESSIPANGFMKNAVFYSLFEPLVIDELKTLFH